MILWVLAGANGSGKSTFYYKFLLDTGIPFVNADEIARERYPQGTLEASQKAQSEAHETYHRLLKKGESFCYETVFSHDSKIEFIQEAKKRGYKVNLVYIHLENPDLNVARVFQRVSEGGHQVSEEKIRDRIPRTLAHIQRVLTIVDAADIYENSNDEEPYALQASVVNGSCTTSVYPEPQWLEELLELVGRG